MSETKLPLPIGYWIKRADEALTARTNEAQQANGLTRIDWQVLNVLHERGRVKLPEITDTLRPFADTATLGEVLRVLVERGYVARAPADAPAYALTDEGRTLHAAAHELQVAVRKAAVEGISEEEYATALGVMEKIVRNLG